MSSCRDQRALGGEALRAWRRENDVSARDLAAVLGMSVRAVHRWEDRTNPSPPWLKVALPEALRRIRHARQLREYRKRRKRREAYRERQAVQRAERARLRRGGGLKGAAWW